MNTKQTQPATEVESHSRRQFLRQAAAGAVIAAPLTGAVAAVSPAKEAQADAAPSALSDDAWIAA